MRSAQVGCLVGLSLSLLSGSLLSGCAVYPADAGYGGYYEPYGYSYSGWGGGFGVAPYGGYRPFAGGRPGGPHAFRAAPAGRGIPSLPSGRGGGGRGGGGRGGGGRGGGGRDGGHGR